MIFCYQKHPVFLQDFIEADVIEWPIYHSGLSTVLYQFDSSSTFLLQ